MRETPILSCFSQFLNLAETEGFEQSVSFRNPVNISISEAHNSPLSALVSIKKSQSETVTFVFRNQS